MSDIQAASHPIAGIHGPELRHGDRMQTVKVGIKVKKGWCLACDMRAPEPTDEAWMIPRENVIYYVKDWRGELPTEPRIILRRAWKWPKWCKAAAIVKFAGESHWHACGKIPKKGLDSWYDTGSLVMLDSKIFDFTPPHCDDWRDSLRINPKHKQH